MIEYYKIITSFPVEKKIDYLTTGGHEEQGYIMLNSEKIFNDCLALKKVSKILKDSDPIGRIGNYKGVFELGMGLECYTPDTGSDPGKGIVGIEEIMRVITFTTYCNPKITNDEQVMTFINSVANVHPWEHPVIQLHKKGQIYLFDKES